MDRRKIVLIDGVVVVVTLLALALVLNNIYGSGVSFSPGEEGVRTHVLFAFSGGQEIWVDDSIRFDSPVRYVVGDGTIVRMDKGKYYWKIIYDNHDEVRSFDVESDVEFVLRDNGDGTFSVVVEDGRYRADVLGGSGEHRTDFVLEGEDA